MRSVVLIALFLLTVLEMTAGLVAGSVALVGLVTESTARALSAGTQRFARRTGVDLAPHLSEGLASVLSGGTAAAEGDVR